MIRHERKAAMHPRNRFRDGYDFAALAAAVPALAAYVHDVHGAASIDFGDPAAVQALNRALLATAYGITDWSLPPGALCPPIPGRSDYVHALADLLASDAGSVPAGPATVILDVGVGANCVYPLIAASEYGWRMVGTDSDAGACRWATQLAQTNDRVAARIEIRHQPDRRACFAHVIRPRERFAATMCNPPFHRSAAEAAAGSARKRRNLGRPVRAPLNFGGRPGELWCDGGELGFITRMIAESVGVATQCRWFTTLVSSSEHLRRLQAAARHAGARDIRTVPMAQGQKQSRMLAWTFQTPDVRNR